MIEEYYTSTKAIITNTEFVLNIPIQEIWPLLIIIHEANIT